MFDTPDLAPLCFAPFVAIVGGFLVYGIGLFIGVFVEKKTGKKPSGWKSIVLGLSIGLAPVICIASVALEIGAFDPAPWFKPTANNIVGTWILSADPTDELPKPANFQPPARELVFDNDGTFQANEIPDMWSYTDISELNHVDYISGSGTWYLTQEQGTQRVEWVLFTEFRKIDNQDDIRTMRFYFQGHLPPYILATLDSGYRRFHFQRK